MGFYALLQTVDSAALFAMTRHMAARDLGARHADGRAADDFDSLGTMLGFGLSIPVFFATTYGWVLWIVMPVLVARANRRRRGRRPAGAGL